MIERPILYNAEMVRAILAGLKTETRRPMKRQDLPPAFFDKAFAAYHWNDGGTEHWQHCLFGKPGDLLHVREAWKAVHSETEIWYRADDGYRRFPERESWFDGDWKTTRGNPHRWRPSIHMPKWACRLWLRVTDVRVERLQDISEDDCWREGLEPAKTRIYDMGRLARTKPRRGEPQCTIPRQAFANLWDRTYAKKGFGWADNPWVWVVSFERTEAPK